MADLTRRDVLGAAVVTAGAAAVDAAQANAAPAAGQERPALPAFRFPLEAQKARVEDGGTAREASVAQFPVSKAIAGVSMRLQPGGLRELHWHANAAEWAYVIRGRCRVTVYDPEGRSETADFGPGDVWYFPRGHGHSIQGLGPDECHFILVFDNGSFSEFATFSITDWLAHTPVATLAKDLGVPVAALKGLPRREAYIVKGAVPPALPASPAPGSQHAPRLTHRYALEAQEPRAFGGGTVRIVSAHEFPISTTMTGALMTLEAKALRELHWHPNADEWQYYIAGRARMTVFASGGRAQTVDFGPGDVGYVPQGYGHYIENIGDAACRMLLVFNSGEYQEIGLSGWLASNPPRLVAANLGLPESVVAKFPRRNQFIAR